MSETDDTVQERRDAANRRAHSRTVKATEITRYRYVDDGDEGNIATGSYLSFRIGDKWESYLLSQQQVRDFRTALMYALDHPNVLTIESFTSNLRDEDGTGS